MNRSRLRPLCSLVVCLLTLPAWGQFELTVFHANDGESALAGTADEGGVHRFIEVLRRERMALDGRPSLLISSGDTYLAGRQLAASLDQLDADPESGRFFDAEAIAAMQFDAVVIGNHEFDLGPKVLGQFIERANRSDRVTPFISANLDFSQSEKIGEAAKAFIKHRVVLDFDGTRVGVIGATTPLLSSISQPGDVVIYSDLRRIVQDQIDDLRSEGVDIIILASHLQSIAEEIDLIGQLSGVDFAIAGGGDELLINDDTPLPPGDEGQGAFGPYPLTEFLIEGQIRPITNADGAVVPVVTTSGHYRYLGRITLHFDEHGALTRFDHLGPVRVVDQATGLPDGVAGDQQIYERIIRPVEAFSADLDLAVIGRLGEGVHLDGSRTLVRSQETGFGNLVADALRAQAIAEFSPSEPVIGLQNGGGIRNDVVLFAGETMTIGHTFDALPFPNFVSIVRGVSPQMLKDTLEHAVSRVERGDGRFLQVSGLRFEYDPTAPARFIDRNGTLRNPGSRVQRVVLDDGTVIVEQGRIVSERTVTIATNDFTAQGGDAHDLGALTPDRYQRTSGTYQQAVARFVRSMEGGVVRGDGYTSRGEGRIVRLEE